MSDELLVPLDGPANFRDLGGHPTADGGRVRRGRVYRSDSLSFLSDADLGVLREQIGVRTVVDMRAGHEVEEFGHGRLAEHVRQLHLPIVDNTRESAARDTMPAARRADSFVTLDEIYAFMLGEYGHRFAGVLDVVADAENQPVVFHCAAGKDRTGIVAALVLSVCGVADEVVVADFAYTERRMPEIIARHTERAGAQAEVAAQHYGAQAAVMQAVLDGLRSEHGSVEAYLATIGCGPDWSARLRAGLVEHP